ncbi:exported hypothetical protein [Verrucomicrobia bacterium]|nr:exported hypothetical protein [Verrucomicrobiota bacterium]
MKNKIILTNVIPRFGRFGAALAALLLLGIAALSSSGQVLPPSSLPYGCSYEEWSAKWWRWYLGQDTNDVELVGSPDICEGPASRVRFLGEQPGPAGLTFQTNHVIIPGETPVFFLIVAGYYDNTACPLSASTSYTADQLATMAEGGRSNIVQITCTIDGVPVAGLEDPLGTVYYVVSPPFSYTTAEEGTIVAVFEGEPCIPGGLTVYPAEAAGVYLMLSPFSPGKHTIQYFVNGGVYGTGGATYDLPVLPDFRRDGKRVE